MVCSNTAITELDISALSNLVSLYCDGTNITSLDLSAPTQLVRLVCANTGITELDLSVLTELEYLDCSGTGIAALDLSALVNLDWLYCSNTGITELEFPTFNDLSELDCSYTGITELDLSALTYLSQLYCAHTGITELDLSALPNLYAVDCSGTGITALDFAGLDGLCMLDCSDTSIAELDLSPIPRLWSFSADNTALQTLCVPAGYSVSMGMDDGTLRFALPKPTRDGYFFTGWYTAETGGERVSLFDRFEETTTLYSRWVDSIVQVVLDNAKQAITTHDWKVGYETANTIETVEAWVEQQIRDMELSGVTCFVEMIDFFPAQADGISGQDRVNGLFAFNVTLTMGNGDNYVEMVEYINNGAIVANASAPTEYTVTYDASSNLATITSLMIPTETNVLVASYEQGRLVSVSAHIWEEDIQLAVPVSPAEDTRLLFLDEGWMPILHSGTVMY